MKRFTWKALTTRYPAFFALILLVIALVVNFILQPNLFAGDTLNSNMRVFLPIILLTAGQAVVILGGGIDISVGAIVSIVNTILATRVGLEGLARDDVAVCGHVPAGGGAGRGGQWLFRCLPAPPADHHHVRDQFSLCRRWLCLFFPIRAAAFLARIAELYRSTMPCRVATGLLRHRDRPAGLGLYPLHAAMEIICTPWAGRAQAAYETGCAGHLVQFSTYVISGLMAAFAGIAITMLSGSGNAEIGASMTLNSITAVVIGGNRHERRRGRRGWAGDGGA